MTYHEPLCIWAPYSPPVNCTHPRAIVHGNGMYRNCRDCWHPLTKDRP